MKKIFRKTTTLKEMVEFLKKAGSKEITRIMPIQNGVIVEWA